MSNTSSFTSTSISTSTSTASFNTNALSSMFADVPLNQQIQAIVIAVFILTVVLGKLFTSPEKMTLKSVSHPTSTTTATTSTTTTEDENFQKSKSTPNPNASRVLQPVPLTTSSVHVDLVIIGTGYAGANAFDAALSHLKTGMTVLIVDKRAKIGGQWVDQYANVRLHQPYSQFTAGGRPWATLTQDAEDGSGGGEMAKGYLAGKDEIINHLEDCFVKCAEEKGLKLNTLFGYSYDGGEVAIDNNTKVEVTFTSLTTSPDTANDTDSIANHVVKVTTPRLIKAWGFAIEILKPLTLSSPNVRSISVVDPCLNSLEQQTDDTPVYVIGSGKTALDCVFDLATKSKNSGKKQRKIVMIAGRGTLYANRSYLFPEDSRRTTYGSNLPSDWYTEIARMYDGTNAQQVYRHYQDVGLFLSPVEDAENFSFGIISQREVDVVKSALAQTIKGRMADVYDDKADGLTYMTILHTDKTTSTIEIERNAYIINCTSHLLETQQPQPILTTHGMVLNPQKILLFSGPSHYLLTDMWFNGRLQGWRDFRRLYVEMEPKKDMGLHAILVFLSNLLQIMGKPDAVKMIKLEGDVNHYFPLYRQIPAMVRIALNKGWIQEKADRILKLKYGDGFDAAGEKEEVVKVKEGGKRRHRSFRRTSIVW